MGLADKRLGAVRYDLSLDADGRITAIDMQLTLACKCYGGTDPVEALSNPHHIVMNLRYALSDFDALEAPEVPQEAAQLLR